MPLQDSRLEPLCWWELRRIIWNILVLLTALVGYSFSSAALGQADHSGIIARMPSLEQLFVCGLLANLLYSFCYFPELFFGILCKSRRWLLGIRWTIFILGCAAGLLLAFATGRALPLWDPNVR